MATYNKTYVAIIPTLQLITHDLVTHEVTYEAIIPTNELITHDLLYHDGTFDAIIPTNELITHDLLIHKRTQVAIIPVLEMMEPPENLRNSPPQLVIAEVAMLVPSWTIEGGGLEVPQLVIAELAMLVPSWSIVEGTNEIFNAIPMTISEASMLVPSWEIRDYNYLFSAPLMEISSMQMNVPTLRFQSKGKIELLVAREVRTAIAGTDATTINTVIPEIFSTLRAEDFIVNETRRGRGVERGSRLVYSSSVGSDVITLEDGITGQQEGDSIRFHQYIEITPNIKPESVTFTRRAGGLTEFEFIYEGTVQYEPDIQLDVGQYIRANISDADGMHNQLFKGTIYNIRKKTIVDGPSAVTMVYECRARGYNSICGRRTIKVDYDEGVTCGSIVTALVSGYLIQEGIKAGTIDDGALLKEPWQEDILSIAEVLDYCATLSAYQWFVDDLGYLQFYQDPDPIPEAAFNIDVDAGTFRDFVNFETERDIEEYCNKMFVVGGADVLGNVVAIGTEDYTEMNELQEFIAGSGVFGKIIRDPSIDDAEYKICGIDTDDVNDDSIHLPEHGFTAEDLPQSILNITKNEYAQITNVSDPDMIEIAPAISGLTKSASFTAEATTSDTLIFITGHSQALGNIIYNATRKEYRAITKIINANSFNVEAITGQIATDVIYMNGDVIIVYPESSNIIRNTLKKQGVIPDTVRFRTKSILLNPGEKIEITYPYIGIDGSFLIEEVRITFPLNKMDIFYADVTCTSRKADDFSTQRRDTFSEYFGGF